jgi:hypothetical protein
MGCKIVFAPQALARLEQIVTGRITGTRLGVIPSFDLGRTIRSAISVAYGFPTVDSLPKNFSAVAQVAVLNSSNETPFTCEATAAVSAT